MVRFNDTTTDGETRNEAGGQSYDPESPALRLYKVVVNNMLEDTYYLDDWSGVRQVREAFDAAADADRRFPLQLAAYARDEMGNRDVAVLLYVLAANDDRYSTPDPDDRLLREFGPKVLRRMDEPATALAINDDLFGPPAPKGLKKGAADAVYEMLGEEYDTGAYRLGKYRLSGREVTLHDAINRIHVRRYADVEDGSHRDRLLTQFMEGDLDDSDVDPIGPPGTWETVVSERGNTAEAWRTALAGPEDSVSRGMGIMARVRNVRNMLQAGLDGEEIFGESELDRLRQSRMFPFRLYQAYRAYRRADVRDAHVERFLEQGIQELVANVPDTWGDTAVGVDVSGSMEGGYVSAGSATTYGDIARFFGGVMMTKGAHAVLFGRNAVTVEAHVDTPALELARQMERQTDREIDTGGTNAWLFMRRLTEMDRSFDRVVFLTDMQAWDTTRFVGGGGDDERTVREWIDRYRDRHGPTAVYNVDLGHYGDLTTPEGYDRVFNVNGWTERIVEFVEYAERPGQATEDVRAYEA